LLVMKRQAVEFATRAEYAVLHPDKARQQIDALPLKEREFLERFGITEANEATADLLASIQEAAADLPAGAGVTYGEVNTHDMLRALHPTDFARQYALDYWVPSAIVHGFQFGMLDTLRRLPNGRLWMSHNSIITDRNQNLLQITGAVMRVLILTGNCFRLYGTHWTQLAEKYNAIVQRFSPDSEVHNLPINASAMRAAAEAARSAEDLGTASAG
jgi:hypothetical protein